jgi:hypothetical protein
MRGAGQEVRAQASCENGKLNLSRNRIPVNVSAGSPQKFAALPAAPERRIDFPCAAFFSPVRH